MARGALTIAGVVIFLLCVIVGGLRGRIFGEIDAGLAEGAVWALGLAWLLYDLANGGVIWQVCERIYGRSEYRNPLTDTEIARIKYCWSHLNAAGRRTAYAHSTAPERAALTEYINIQDYAPTHQVGEINDTGAHASNAATLSDALESQQPVRRSLAYGGWAARSRPAHGAAITLNTALCME